MRPTLLRSVALPVLVTAGLLLLVLAIMLTTTTRSLARMTPLREHLAVMQRLHDQILAMQYVALRDMNQEARIDPAVLARLTQSVGLLIQESALLAQNSRNRISQVHILT